MLDPERIAEDLGNCIAGRDAVRFTAMQFRAPIKYYRQGTPLSGTDLQAAEKTHEISVPPGLRDFLLTHGCGMLSPNLEFEAAGRVFVIKDIEHPSRWGCISIPGVLSFASSPFGDRYSISCRQQDYGIIYFEDHEEVHPDDWLLHTVCKVSLIPPQWVRGVTKIADSWEELESMLRPMP